MCSNVYDRAATRDKLAPVRRHEHKRHDRQERLLLDTFAKGQIQPGRRIVTKPFFPSPSSFSYFYSRFFYLEIERRKRTLLLFFLELMKIVSVRDIAHVSTLRSKKKERHSALWAPAAKKGLKRRIATTTHVWNDNNSANGEGKPGRHPGKFNEPGWGMIDTRIAVPNTTDHHHLGVFFFFSFLVGR